MLAMYVGHANSDLSHGRAAAPHRSGRRRRGCDDGGRHPTRSRRVPHRRRCSARSEPTPRPRCPLATSGTVADVLVDTDIFIDHLRGAAEIKPGGHRLHYSVITRAELVAGSTASDLIQRLLAPFRELPV